MMKQQLIEMFSLEGCVVNAWKPKAILMPAGSKILSVCMKSAPCLIALVDREETEFDIRSFVLYGEGVPFPIEDVEPYRINYIGSFAVQNFVWNILEVLPAIDEEIQG